MINHLKDKNNVMIKLLMKSLPISVLFTVVLSLLMTGNVYAQSVQSWQVVHDKSRLGFTSSYGGVEFDGRFEKFTAKILFDPDNPEAGLFDVDIDVTSITTFSSERDTVIGDQDWFYFGKYPKSKYVTRSIKAVSGNKFVAVGTLDLKGKKKDVELRFTWDEYPNGDVKVEGQARMLANADINRVEFGIGSGSWAKDDTIPFVVMVKINLLLTKE